MFNSSFINRVGRSFIGLFAIIFVLLASHKGEFWPFSIYPMFSKAGNPWSRAVVRDVSTSQLDNIDWAELEVSDLPGAPFKLNINTLDNIDYANFINKTAVWTPERIAALRSFFNKYNGDDKILFCYSVKGRLDEEEDIEISAHPYVILTPDTVWINPILKTEGF